MIEQFAINCFGKKPVSTTLPSLSKEVLGGKGAALHEMCMLGLNVPAGFTIPCSASVEYNVLQENKVFPDVGEAMSFKNMVHQSILNGMEYVFSVAKVTPKSGPEVMPLLSVRSGARVSMPGMMDTILNVGITTANLPTWKSILGERAALDCYRRLIQMYGSVALGIDHKEFEKELQFVKSATGAKSDSDLPVNSLAVLVDNYHSIVEKATGSAFPDTIESQVEGAVYAVFKSWNNPRAIEYRNIHNIPHDWGTAVTVQSMVFGNLNDQSASGVLFSRCPQTGQNAMVGEYLVNAQGEDVVAGIRTPESVEIMLKDGDGAPWGLVWTELLDVCDTLEEHYKDMQDIEFTVQNGEVFILQTRSAKRSAAAAINVAYDLEKEGLITKKEALFRINSKMLVASIADYIDPTFKKAPILTGIASGGGIVSGNAVFSSEAAKAYQGVACILVTKETNPDDIGGMNASVGILTATGGLTSHAAVVARGMNKSCVVGCTGMVIQGTNASDQNGNSIFNQGDLISIDGNTGKVWLGKVPTIEGKLTSKVLAFSAWSNPIISKFRVDLPKTFTKESLTECLAMYGSNHVVIDTATFHTPAEMIALGEAVYGYKGDVFIDLAAEADHYGVADKFFTGMFGEGFPDLPISMKVQAIKNFWDPDILKNVRLITTVPYGNTLVASGWPVLSHTSPLKSHYWYELGQEA